MGWVGYFGIREVEGAFLSKRSNPRKVIFISSKINKHKGLDKLYATWRVNRRIKFLAKIGLE